MPSSRHSERSRILAAQLGERIDRVGHAAAAHLAVVHHEARLVGDRRPAPCARAARRVAYSWSRCGGLPVGRNRTSASCSSCHSSNAVRRWPQWIGSKVPPNRPMGAISGRSAAQHGLRRGRAAAQLRGEQRHLVPGIPAQASLDHAVGARGAQRQLRERQPRGAAAAPWRARPPGAARPVAAPSPARALHTSRSALVSAHSASVASVPSARSPASMRSARGASPSEHRLAELEHVEARAVGDARPARPRAVTSAPSSASFCSSWCAASRFPSVRAASSCSASSPTSSPSARARPRSQPTRRGASTGQICTQAPWLSSARTHSALCASRSRRGASTSSSVSGSRGGEQRRQCGAAGDAGLAAREADLDARAASRTATGCRPQPARRPSRRRAR